MKKVSLAQINPTLGDFKANAKKILHWTRKAKLEGADLVVFPECALFGYHPFDLIERVSVVEEQLRILETLPSKIPPGIAVVLGVISLNKKKQGRRYHNSAAFLMRGKKPRVFHKQLLPTEDVFDEGRFIEPGDLAQNFLTYKGKTLFLCICEDIWAWGRRGERNLYPTNPLLKLKRRKVDLVINLSASPFYLGKQEARERLVKKTAAHFKAPTLYANLVGAQDEIVYDGGSFVCSPKGKKLLQCSQFEEDLCTLDLATFEAPRKKMSSDKTELLRRAIVSGIRDYSVKVGIHHVHFGLSGGIDSAVVAALACEALGPNMVSAVALPTSFNSPASLTLAQQLASRLNIEFFEFPIQKAYDTINKSLERVFKVEGFSLTQENLQARIRGLILMAFANDRNSLLLSTSNKSEMATGYSTLYGDMNGALAPLGDLLKSQVYALAELYNAEQELIPREIIDRPPSAELRPDQKDQDSLPPYDELDRAVEKLVVNVAPARTKDEKWLLGQLMRTEFKRWQAPPIIKVSRHAFGRGRRYPIAHRARI